MYPRREQAPGTWLAGQLAANRFRNVTRKPARQDPVDLGHVSHFPYMDIATCDRQVFDAIAPHITSARGARTVALFRNADLPALVEYVDSLPHHDDYLKA